MSRNRTVSADWIPFGSVAEDDDIDHGERERDAFGFHV